MKCHMKLRKQRCISPQAAQALSLRIAGSWTGYNCDSRVMRWYVFWTE